MSIIVFLGNFHFVIYENWGVPCVLADSETTAAAAAAAARSFRPDDGQQQQLPHSHQIEPK